MSPLVVAALGVLLLVISLLLWPSRRRATRPHHEPTLPASDGVEEISRQGPPAWGDHRAYFHRRADPIFALVAGIVVLLAAIAIAAFRG